MNPGHFTGEVNWPHRVTRHNLVYRTPPCDPLQGWALGNGEIGLLIWCEASRLVCVVNRSDLWEDGLLEFFHNWALDEEEHSTTLRHGGRFSVDFGMPVFDRIYLRECRCELDLSCGMLSGQIESAFGLLEFEAYVPENTDSVRLRFTNTPAEPAALTFRLERYGSRTFSHWYSQLVNDPAIGLESTQSALLDDGGMALAHRLSDGWFGLAAVVDNAETFRRVNRFAVEAVAANGGMFEISLGITAPEHPDPATAQQAAQAAALAIDDREAHREIWRRFWSASHLETADGYLDGLWHLHMYYCHAGQRGRYPGRFIGSLWSWQRDCQPWNFYFHWNQQMTYWPLWAAGHADTARPYLEWRWRGLDQARRAARELFDADGGWVSDVCDRRGFPSAHETMNHTPMAQIALEFYRCYRQTGDTAFLKERALPYMTEAAVFLAGRFEKGPDGRYHARTASSYEGWIAITDAATELATARALLPRVLEAQEIAGSADPRTAGFAELLANLVPFTFGDDLEAFSDDAGHCGVGLFKGTPWNGEKRLAAGYLEADGEVTFTTFPARPAAPEAVPPQLTALRWQHQLPAGEAAVAEVADHQGTFPHSELSLVYPSGLVSVGRPDDPLFRAAVNTALIEARPGGILAWDPEPIMLARLGLGDQAFAFLQRFITFWQCHPNGWFCDSNTSRESIYAETDSFVYDLERQAIANSWDPVERRRIDVHPFRHMGLEGMGVVATALNECLLQSHDGVIRVAPAIPDDFSGNFTLHAEGGHRVSARITAGHVDWILVTPGWEGEFLLANPWKRALAGGGATQERIIAAGNELFLTDADQPCQGDCRLDEAEAEAKIHPEGIARLGLGKIF